MTDSTTELQAIREELAEIRAALPHRRKRPRDYKLPCNIRLDDHELAAVDAAAQQKGLSRSEFVRQTLAAVVGFTATPRIEPPLALQHARNRRKPTHFHDPKVPLERDPREQARKAVNLGLQRQAIMRELRDDPAPAPVIQGMLSETAAVRISVPKPSR